MCEDNPSLWLEADTWNTPPRLELGTFLGTFILPPRGAPISRGWTLLTQRSHPSFAQMPRVEHTLLDASLVSTFLLPPVPMVQSFSSPDPTQPL